MSGRKRPHEKRPDDTSVIGKIYSVSCENFVTYDKVTMYPGKHLNLIIGPNGTGKSTLVAAIIIGMGGNPKILSRSTRILDYIKNGKSQASTSIQIFVNSSKRLMTFERKFDLEEKNVWKVDGNLVSQKEFLAKVAKFNIQVDNLCQFLPQDKVQDFAKMNAQQLLESTQLSVCGPELSDSLKKLKEFRSTQVDSTKSLSQNKQKLLEAEQRNAELKTIIDAMEVRKGFLTQIEVCLRKKNWIEYDVLNEKQSNVKKELDQAKVFLNRDKKVLNEVTKESKSILDYISKFDKNIKAEDDKMKTYLDTFSRLTLETEELENSITRASSELQVKKNEEAERENEIKKANLVLEAILQDLKNAKRTCGSDENFKQKEEEFHQKLQENRSTVKELMDKHRLINRQLDEIFQPQIVAMKNKINRIENIGERRLNILRDRFEPTYKAVLWLRANKHLFEEDVFEPMILELNVKDGNNAKFVENSVNLRDLLAFTCVNKSDMDLLMRKLTVEQKIPINAVHSAQADQCHYGPKVPIESMRQYGFYSYLIDMIDGPPPILNYLCKANNIQNILIGNDKVYNNLEILPKNVRQFYTSRDKFIITVSKYTGESSSMQNSINAKNLLTSQIDQSELNGLKIKLKGIIQQSDGLKNNRTDVEGLITEKEAERTEINSEKKVFEGKRNKILEHTEHLKRQKLKVESIKNSAIDIKNEEDQFQTFANQSICELLELQKEKITCLRDYHQSSKNREYNYTKMNIYRQENADIENKLKHSQEVFANSEKLVSEVIKAHESCTMKCKKKYDEAKKACNGKEPSNPNFPHKSFYQSLPNDLDSVKDKMDELQARVDCMGTSDQSIFEEYETRKLTIETLRNAISNGVDENSNLDAEMLELHNKWYPKITEIVDIINTNFSQFMHSMEYAGEVQLIRKEERDYNDYGIQILVQYRSNTKLQPLDRLVQSGGERAVAIAVYTLSLQRITSVPFRCVDEINQGMDPRNERKIFEMLVENTAKVGQSQYFFVTPKLLPNLTYNDLMTVNIVHNGKYVQDDDIFNGIVSH